MLLSVEASKTWKGKGEDSPTARIAEQEQSKRVSLSKRAPEIVFRPFPLVALKATTGRPKHRKMDVNGRSTVSYNVVIVHLQWLDQERKRHIQTFFRPVTPVTGQSPGCPESCA